MKTNRKRCWLIDCFTGDDNIKTISHTKQDGGKKKHISLAFRPIKLDSEIHSKSSDLRCFWLGTITFLFFVFPCPVVQVLNVVYGIEWKRVFWRCDRKGLWWLCGFIEGGQRIIAVVQRWQKTLYFKCAGLNERTYYFIAGIVLLIYYDWLPVII